MGDFHTENYHQIIINDSFDDSDIRTVVLYGKYIMHIVNSRSKNVSNVIEWIYANSVTLIEELKMEDIGTNWT